MITSLLLAVRVCELVGRSVCQSLHEVKTITVCQAFIMNSDERREARLRNGLSVAA